MRVAVCIHRVLDPEATVRLGDGHGVDGGEAPEVLDPVDAAALEAAVSLVEGGDGEVVAITIGTTDADEAMRTALAQGASVAVRLDADPPADSAQAGAWLAAAIQGSDSFDLVLCGARSSDHGGGGTAASLAARLDLPVVQNVVAIERVEDGSAVVRRRRDGGFREVVRVELPAVLAVDANVAQPRFPTTRARLQAERAEIVASAPASAPDAPPRAPGYRHPPPRRSGIPWPEQGMDARDRLRFLVQGGAHRSAGTGQTVTGTSQEVAATIARFFRDEQLIAPTAAHERQV
jgi:electron transfer flavoprotein beta subunit